MRAMLALHRLSVPGGMIPLQNKSIIGTIYGSADCRQDFVKFVNFAKSGDLDLAGMISRRIKIGDIKGESQDKDHKDFMDVLSWSWGLAQTGGGHAGGGAGAGKVSVHDLQATILHTMGLNHKQLTYAFQGLNQTLTPVNKPARVITELFA